MAIWQPWLLQVEKGGKEKRKGKEGKFYTIRKIALICHFYFINGNTQIFISRDALGLCDKGATYWGWFV